MILDLLVQNVRPWGALAAVHLLIAVVLSDLCVKMGSHRSGRL
jgi:hypothetical protein